MKKILLLLMMALTEVMSLCAEVRADDCLQKMESYLNEVAEAYHIPGMAVLITNPKEALFEKSYGQCTSLDQQFYIGSMSKSYTALCIMQLVEKGLVSLDADISLYLPDYKFLKPVTLLALLNQTSGFDTHAKLHNVKQKKSYGKYEYANVNYDLLGKIIEAVSGQTYEGYIKQNVFEPLSMEDSKANAWAVKDSPKLLLGNRNYFGFFKRGPAVFPVEKSWFHEPAGYIAATPHDHAKYLRMYLNEGKSGDSENQLAQILSPEGIQKMWYKNVSEDDNHFDLYYGMGWNYMNWKGQTVLFHGGQVENGITFQYILPDKKNAVCFMINASDYLVMNELMNGVIFESIEILKGGEAAKVNHSVYILMHLLCDVIYLLILGFSIFILYKAIKSKPGFSVKKIICGIIGYILWPLLLLSATKLFADTPLWVVRLFVTDLYIIIVASAICSFGAVIIRCVRLIN